MSPIRYFLKMLVYFVVFMILVFLGSWMEYGWPQHPKVEMVELLLAAVLTALLSLYLEMRKRKQ